MGTLKRKSYAASQFSVTLYRENERANGRRNYLIIVMNAFCENYMYLIVVMLNSHKYCNEYDNL